MQWSGRKKENGQIDPSFCRVLFYLELENSSGYNYRHASAKSNFEDYGHE